MLNTLILLMTVAFADDVPQTALERIPETPPYLRDCFEAAAKKMARQAEAWDSTLDPSTIELDQVDDRTLNPYKYVWFTGVANKADGTREIIRVITQKSFLPPKACF